MLPKGPINDERVCAPFMESCKTYATLDMEGHANVLLVLVRRNNAVRDNIEMENGQWQAVFRARARYIFLPSLAARQEAEILKYVARSRSEQLPPSVFLLLMAKQKSASQAVMPLLLQAWHRPARLPHATEGRGT